MSAMSQLKHQGNVISLEAVSGETALLSALNRLPSYLGKVQGIFADQLGRTMRTMLDFAASFTNSSRRLRRLDYARYRDTKVQVPQGLKTDMLSYVKVLGSATESVTKIDREVIEPLLAWLNSNLGRPEDLRSLTGGISVAGFKPINSEAVLKTIDACFSTDGRQEAMVPYGQAIKRSADWDEIDKVSADIRRAFSPALHKNIQAKMGDLQVTLDTLIMRLTKDPARYSPNAKVLKEIVDSAYQAAEAIELYGILRHRYQEFEHSVEQIGKDLDK